MKTRRRRRLRFELFFLFSLFSYALFFILIGHENRENEASTSSSSSPKTIHVPMPNFHIKPETKQQTSERNPVDVRRNSANSIGIVDGRVKEQLEKSDGALWELSNAIPQWMKDYFYWHREQRSLITKDNWKEFHYYVLRCTPDYRKCGGTADRLGPLPFHLIVANQTRRILMIHWTVPTELEHFLLPPKNGIDWRVPDYLWANFENMTVPTATSLKRVRLISKRNYTLVRIKYQAHDHGQLFYNNTIHESEQPFQEVYHDIFRVFFTPTPPIAHEVQHQMHLLGLRPGKFIASHFRAFYGVENRTDDIVQYWAQNTIRCALLKLSNPEKYPILFVSESSLAVDSAVAYGKRIGAPVLARHHTDDHLHLEKSNVSDPALLYETFVDFYMLGMSNGTSMCTDWAGRIEFVMLSCLIPV